MLIENSPWKYPIFVSEEAFPTNMDESENIPALETLDGALTTRNHMILHLPEFKELRDWIEVRLNHYFHEICQVDETRVQLYITQSWINFQRKGVSRGVHSHSNSVVSGVFYIKGTKDIPIRFQRPNLVFGNQIIPPIKKTNGYNAEHVSLKNSLNKLILFPSNLLHAVPENTDEEVRISLAFNTFIKGKLGYNDALNNLYLGELEQNDYDEKIGNLELGEVNQTPQGNK